MEELKRACVPCVALKGETAMHESVAKLLNSDPSRQFRVLSMTVASPVVGRKAISANDRYAQGLVFKKCACRAFGQPAYQRLRYALQHGQ